MPVVSTPSIDKSALGAPIATIAPAATRFPGEFSMSELFVWLSSTMGQTDKEIRTQMSQMQGAKDKSAAMQKVVSELNAMKDAAEGADDHGAGIADPSELKTLMDQLKAGKEPDWLKTAPSTVRDAICKFKDDYMSGDSRVHLDQIKPAISTLTDEISAIGSNNDLQMIRLQSAISSRSQALQLVSQMMASFNETAMKPIQHIGGS